jgi:exodeoxyribonuclease VII large subunit
VRGLPRRADLLALAQQRFDAAERRLGRALLANTRAHAMQLARSTARLNAPLLEARLARTHDRLDALSRRAAASLARATGPRRARLERAAGRLGPQSILERVGRCHERAHALAIRAHRSVLAHMGEHRRHLDACGKLLGSLSYHGVLKRGFALARDSTGQALRSIREIAAGQLIDVELADGRIDAQVLSGGAKHVGKRQSPARLPAKTKTRTSGSQGSLF